MYKQINASNSLKGILVVVVLIFMFSICMQPKEDFTVYADDQKVVLNVSKWRSPKKIIKLAGFALGENDSYIKKEGNTLEVLRAVNVTVVNGNDKRTIATSEKTVADLLLKLNVDVAEGKVYPDLSESLKEQMTVVVLNDNETVLQERQEIPFNVIRQTDSRLELGGTRVVNEGVKGHKDVLVKLVTLSTGEVLRYVLGETMLSEPQDKIVAFGSSNTISTSRGSTRFSKMIQMTATAYTPRDAGCTGITKMGIPAKRGIVAVDPKVIPLGTKLYIPGYGFALAADIGGAIKGNKIDLCVDTKKEAFSYGRRSAKVYILE